MSIDREKLKALAEAATQSHGARRVEVDHNGVHVIGDGSWKILSAWHTPDGKGAQNAEFAAVASPATVLALLAEIDDQALQARSAREVCLESQAAILSLISERDQLKAENEALRKDAERYRFLRIGVSRGGGSDFCIVKKHWLRPELERILSLDGADDEIDAAMAKEAK